MIIGLVDLDLLDEHQNVKRFRGERSPPTLRIANSAQVRLKLQNRC